MPSAAPRRNSDLAWHLKITVIIEVSCFLTLSS